MDWFVSWLVPVLILDLLKPSPGLFGPSVWKRNWPTTACLLLHLTQGFHYPLFMTLVHLAINFCLSALTRKAMQCWTGKPRIVLKWTDYLYKVAPTGTGGLPDISFRDWRGGRKRLEVIFIITAHVNKVISPQCIWFYAQRNIHNKIYKPSSF